MTFRSLILSSLLLASTAFAAPASTPAPVAEVVAAFSETQSSEGIAAAEQSTATVQAIDKKTRTITLKQQDGTVVNSIAPAAMRNFDQMKAGDIVTTTSGMSLDVQVLKNTSGPISEEQFQRFTRPKTGEKPSTTIVRGTRIVADVTAVDAATQTITLEGPVQVGKLKIQNPDNFKKIAVGNQLSAVITEVIEISVATAAK
jgi:Cu/Ag efflux protein CusF